MNDLTKDVKDDYAGKLDVSLKGSISTWFNGLSKNEILHFIADRQDITADVLRNMFAKSDVTIGFGVSFDTVSNDAAANFDDTK